LTAIKGESIEIVCEAFGDQPIVIVWSKSGQEIETGKDLRYTFQESITEKGTIAKLKIKSALRLDSTLFTITVSTIGIKVALIGATVLLQRSTIATWAILTICFKMYTMLINPIQLTLLEI